ncbi:hypothetical protein [Halorubrum sp. N11]|uniref:transcriptional regulator FilR1 domain-containing protein n=1 Tax=Halorubrum sp. N11 TaxID=3402276 RepID=UPI003EB85278
MTDTDTPGAVLREVVAEAVGTEESESGAIDADLVERGDEPGPVSRLAGLVAAGDTVVGVVPRADPALARRFISGRGETDRGDEETVRLVFTGRAADRLAGPSGTAVRSLLADRGIEAYRHDGDSPIGVLLVDDRAVVGLFDEGGLAALLWSDAPAVREWAATTCRRYLSAAEPV